MAEISSAELNKLTEKLLCEHAVDFRDYKPTTLSRRVQRRFEATNSQNIEQYLQYLGKHADEYYKLIDSILINVTEFFRDPEAWEIIRAEVIPQILAVKRPSDEIRMWSSGCATGEEPFTLAMMLTEALGQDIGKHEVRIYATDIDDNALAVARRAEYSDDAVEKIPPELREKHLTKNARWTVNREIRKMVIFGRHNMATDAPISRVDLITCRNVLIYMMVDLQNRVLSKFHYALNQQGFLFLGKAESPLSASRMFQSFQDKWRIFQKESSIGMPAGLTDQARVGQAADIGGAEYQLMSLFNEAVLRYAPSGIIGMDGKGIIKVVNPIAESTWGLDVDSVLGKSIYDIKLRSSLQELLPRVQQVKSQRTDVKIDQMDLSAEQHKPYHVSVTISTMSDIRGNPMGVTIVTENITNQVRFRNDLEAAYEQLQAANEELETTNEELQSTNEELETTNEELQSTNEELETTNEELQSTNEELATTNDELGMRTEDLDRLSLYFNSVLQSLDVPLIALDEKHAVTTWNHAAETFYGIPTAQALNRSFFELKLPVKVARTRDKLRSLKETRKTYRSRPIEYTTDTGEARKVVIEYQPLLDSMGKYRGALSIVRDSKVQPLETAKTL